MHTAQASGIKEYIEKKFLTENYETLWHYSKFQGCGGPSPNGGTLNGTLPSSGSLQWVITSSSDGIVFRLTEFTVSFITFIQRVLIVSFSLTLISAATVGLKD